MYLGTWYYKPFFLFYFFYIKVKKHGIVPILEISICVNVMIKLVFNAIFADSMIYGLISRVFLL